MGPKPPAIWVREKLTPLIGVKQLRGNGKPHLFSAIYKDYETLISKGDTLRGLGLPAITILMIWWQIVRGTIAPCSCFKMLPGPTFQPNLNRFLNCFSNDVWKQTTNMLQWNFCCSWNSNTVNGSYFIFIENVYVHPLTLTWTTDPQNPHS